MSTLDLEELHDFGGISVPNFFNGRILSAEDLRLLLAGDRAHRRLLGRALGAGVAEGLRVSTAGGSLLTVSGGLAVNSYGETIDLPTDIEVDVRETKPSIFTSSGIFVECFPEEPGVSDTINTFVLTIRPDSQIEGSAPSDVVTAGTSCGPGYLTEGVRFRRVPVDPFLVARALGSDPIDPLGLAGQNRLAHALLGSVGWRQLIAEPLAPDSPDATTSVQADIGIEDCEVPLAVFVMQGKTVGHVDEWAVRRHGSGPISLGAGHTEDLLARSRAARASAAQFHFQRHLAHVLAKFSDPVAANHSPWLPAAGILPADIPGEPADPNSLTLDAAKTFLGDAEVLNRLVSLSEVEWALRQSLDLPATSLDAPDNVSWSIGLIAQTRNDVVRRLLFFRDDHPLADRIRLEELEDRIEVLEVTEPGPVRDVSVYYSPQATVSKGPTKAGSDTETSLLERLGGTTGSKLAGGTPITGKFAPPDPTPLGARPELDFGEAGILRFIANPTQAGLHTVDIVLKTSPKTTYFATTIQRVDGLPLTVDQQLVVGKNVIDVLVVAPVPPKWSSLQELLATVDVTVTSTADPDVSDNDDETITIGESIISRTKR